MRYRCLLELNSYSPIYTKNSMIGAAMKKNENIQINRYDDDFGAVCNCAVRYAIGRMTYMPSIVAGFIKPLLPKLNNRTLWCLERDIEGANSYGDPGIDKPLWMGLLEAVKDEIKKRGDVNEAD